MNMDYISDVDECKRDTNLCENGRCINTPGSFRCDCNTGYRYNQTAHTCEGIVQGVNSDKTGELDRHFIAVLENFIFESDTWSLFYSLIVSK